MLADRGLDNGEYLTLPTAEVSSTLVMMELKGMVQQVAPLTYAQAR